MIDDTPTVFSYILLFHFACIKNHGYCANCAFLYINCACKGARDIVNPRAYNHKKTLVTLKSLKCNVTVF